MAQHIEYFIDNILQDYTPALPDSTKVILLDDEACIGYADIVDRTNCQFKMYTDKSTTEEDIADYEEYMSCMLGGATALVDDDDNYLVDEDGNFIVEG